MRDIVFGNFDIAKGNVSISRNSTSHGIAEPKKYTKARALQTILILDQLDFYIKDKLVKKVDQKNG